MNLAIILSGGTGTRLGTDIPKQYLMVQNKKIIEYTLQSFLNNDLIHKYIIVLASEWIDSLHNCGLDNSSKFLCFAKAGNSRQESIFNGLIQARAHGVLDDDLVIIHDAARPNISCKLITDCLEPLIEDKNIEGVMPVLPVKDTMYLSENGVTISSLINRDILFAGQSPEAFRFGKYLNLHYGLTSKELADVRGSSVIAYQNGLSIKLIQGDEHNYKITTRNDLEKFKSELMV